MGKINQSAKSLPTPETFRVWLESALKTLKVSAYTIAVDLGLGRNTVATFLSNGRADIRLSTAKALQAELSRRAAACGAALPELAGSELGGVVDG